MRRAAVALLAAAVYAASGSALADNSGGTIDGDGNYVGEPTEYTVIIDSGFDGNVYGHKEDGNADVEKASVTVTGGTVNNSVYGGYSNSGNVASNCVNINDGDNYGVYGGYDSTSAVDTATDAKIRKALKEAIPGTTRFIIAQRISSVQDADRIIVMEEGEVNGFGTHEELLANNAIYKEVFESQTGANADFDESKGGAL